MTTRVRVTCATPACLHARPWHVCTSAMRCWWVRPWPAGLMVHSARSGTHVLLSSPGDAAPDRWGAQWRSWAASRGLRPAAHVSPPCLGVRSVITCREAPTQPAATAGRRSPPCSVWTPPSHVRCAPPHCCVAAHPEEARTACRPHSTPDPSRLGTSKRRRTCSSVRLLACGHKVKRKRSPRKWLCIACCGSKPYGKGPHGHPVGCAPPAEGQRQSQRFRRSGCWCLLPTNNACACRLEHPLGAGCRPSDLQGLLPWNARCLL